MIIYPPLITDVIPAFISTKVIIPFENNPAVGINQATNGFHLVIKEYGSSKIIGQAHSTQLNSQGVNSVIFSFDEEEAKKLFSAGNYYKFQIAYSDSTEQTTYYYSSASIGRCVEEEKNIYIAGSNISLQTSVSNPEKYGIYQGVYTTPMLSEPLYSYQFIIKDPNDEVFLDSGVQIYDNSISPVQDINGNYIYTTEFIVKKELKDAEKPYTLQFFITTINGYTTKSAVYNLIKDKRQQMSVQGINFSIKAVDFENGYVEISLSGTPNSAAKLQIERTQDDGETWIPMVKYDVIGDKEINFTWKDLSVEQGTTYKYALVQRASNIQEQIIYYSERVVIGTAIPDFENIFLTDGEKQLKIKYDPKVSSFRDTILETKTDTIGGQYPFFFRNGQVRYKEIPISGLISYQLDRENFFMNDEELGLSEKSSLRNQTNSQESFDNIPTTDLVGYNYTAERKFKLAVLEWLINGEPKLFRSPSEGNYVIRLMNVSLSPNDTLGRMIHSFSCTGYECAAADIENLQTSGLIQQPEIIEPELVEAEWEIYSALYNDIFDITNNNDVDIDLVSKITVPSGKSIIMKDLEWYLVKTGIDTNDYIIIGDSDAPILNPKGMFKTPEDFYFDKKLILHRVAEPLNQTASISFKYRFVDNASNYIDNFANSVNNGVDIAISIPINVTVKEVFENIKPLAIYTIIARRDINAKDSDNFTLTLGDQIIDLSDGQIRTYNNVISSVEKGNGVHLDMYIRVQDNSRLDHFILDVSRLGGAGNV